MEISSNSRNHQLKFVAANVASSAVGATGDGNPVTRKKGVPTSNHSLQHNSGKNTRNIAYPSLAKSTTSSSPSTAVASTAMTTAPLSNTSISSGVANFDVHDSSVGGGTDGIGGGLSSFDAKSPRETTQNMDFVYTQEEFNHLQEASKIMLQRMREEEDNLSRNEFQKDFEHAESRSLEHTSQNQNVFQTEDISIYLYDAGERVKHPERQPEVYDPSTARPLQKKLLREKDQQKYVLERNDTPENPASRFIPLNTLPVKPHAGRKEDRAPVNANTRAQNSTTLNYALPMKSHFQSLLPNETRPTSVFSEDSLLFDGDADFYKLNVEVDGTIIQAPVIENPTKPQVLKIQTDIDTGTTKRNKNQTGNILSTLVDEAIESPGSPDSMDKFIASKSMPTVNMQPLKRSATYYRNLLTNERPSDVSYLLDSELKNLTMHAKKPKKKLPPLNGRNKISFQAKETITFPSILDEVLKMVGQPTTFNLPSSKIPKDYHISQEFPVKSDQKKNAVYDAEKGIWVSQVFPSKIPASRVEVVHLSRVFEEMVREVKETAKINSVDELSSIMDILDAVGMEIVRQVHVHCGERGVLLKILIDSFQMVNKQALIYYHKAKQVLQSNNNETKVLMEKVANLTTLMSQKESETNLYRNEIHELKMQLRTQGEKLQKVQKEKDVIAEELKSLQEAHSKLLKHVPNKNVGAQTEIDAKSMEFLESKAMNALDYEQKRIEERKRAEREEMAALKALKEAEEALRKAKEENIRNAEIAKQEDDFADKENDKRLQTDDTEITEMAIQTEDVKIQKKRKLDKKLKYKSTASNPKPPPTVIQPSMIPHIQPLSLLNEYEIRENRVDEMDNETEWNSERNSESDDDIITYTARIKGNKPDPSSSHEVAPSKARNATIDAVLKTVNSKKQKKVVESTKNDRQRNIEVKLKTLQAHDIFELFHDLILKGNTSRIYSLRWVNRYVLDIFSELMNSDFMTSTTDLRNVRKFVYDYHLVKFGLPTIAVQHLLDLLHNVQHHYKESSRSRVFIQFNVLAQWYGKDQQDIYTVSTLSLYLKALQITRGLLNKKALKELEDGCLFVSETFVFNLLERIRLPLSQAEQRVFFDTVLQQFEDGYIYFDDLMILLIAASHKHEERKRSQNASIPQLNAPATSYASSTFNLPEPSVPAVQIDSKPSVEPTKPIDNNSTVEPRLTVSDEYGDVIGDKDNGREQPSTSAAPTKPHQTKSVDQPLPRAQPPSLNETSMPQEEGKKELKPTSQLVGNSLTDLQSISVDDFNKAISPFFGNMYMAAGKDFPTQIYLNPASTKRDLVQAYVQAQKPITEMIHQFEKADVKSKFQETNSNLYRIITELPFEESLVHYRNYICVLLRETGQPSSLLLSRLLITLFKK